MIGFERFYGKRLLNNSPDPLHEVIGPADLAGAFCDDCIAPSSSVIWPAGPCLLWSVYAGHGAVAQNARKGGVITKLTGSPLADLPSFTVLIEGSACNSAIVCDTQEAIAPVPRSGPVTQNRMGR